MHPDQATEAIVDVALAAGTSFAVVPCCTFAHLAPHRRLASGAPVQTYDEFVAYLREKSPHTRVSALPFQGRNLVVWLDATRRPSSSEKVVD